MLPIHYSKRIRTKTRLHTGTMTPIRQDSQRGWNRYVEERDQRLHFDEAKQKEGDDYAEK